MASDQMGYATNDDGSPHMTSSGEPLAPGGPRPTPEQISRWIGIIILASLAWLVVLGLAMRRRVLP